MHPSSGGFTLVELITAVALIGVLSVALAPNVSDWTEKRGVTVEVDESKILLSYAKAYSISNRIATRVTYDEGSSSLVVSSGGALKTCATSAGWQRLNTKVKIKKSKIKIAATDTAICFYRDGSASGGEIEFTNNHARYVLAVFSATGFIELRKEG